MLQLNIIGTIVGYFAIMLVFMVLGIIFAKRTAGWILYLIGGGLQLISLIGRSRSFSMYGSMFSGVIARYWVIYAVILLVCGIIIAVRRSKE